MNTISYADITVDGFPFQKIEQLLISHAPNDHGYAEVVGELDSSTAQDFLKRVDEKMMVSITSKAEGQPTNLFFGCVRNVSLQQETEYSKVTLQLYSMSRILDMEKKNKTYQNTAKTYGQIISADISDKGDLHMMVSDKAIGALIMKYNETDWQFAMRMAAKLNAPLVSNLSSPRPQIYIGLPPASKTITVKKTSYSYGSDTGAYAQMGSGALAQDFGSEQIESYEYGYVGDQITFGEKSGRIKSVKACLKDGILTMSYGLLSGGGSAASASAGASAGSGTGGFAGIAAPVTPNAQASGKMMRGKVMAVSGDKVQVHLTDVDSSYDGGGSWWFPYSTAYSSSDGSGWYCMPEIGDEVRVFFPSGNEGDAFAASSVCANPPTNPKHKSWKAPGGKEILLTDEGMYIIGKSGKIYINLTDEKGIEIHSDKDINISSDANININSSSEVQIVAKNQIIIGTESAYLDLTQNSATLAASQVLIN
ncbi:phage baseplate assembly protein V [Lachnotalea glycerini]|uniref:Gp5/Type VI secretion system Vgr protein OB-fold domain-containing protein n=1 Tax=Lachnotalea glycerini TaxID=1763509 RepID=A0A371J4S9_9FIRM|nr:phage baseplate assembly protein V [Lachnotalea glycerini]RDY27782.1 hypothetical protein CG710_020325 [Lachnotalea glycerini]